MLIEYGRKLGVVGETLWCLIGYNWDQFLIAEFNFRTSELHLAFFPTITSQKSFLSLTAMPF